MARKHTVCVNVETKYYTYLYTCMMNPVQYTNSMTNYAKIIWSVLQNIYADRRDVHLFFIFFMIMAWFCVDNTILFWLKETHNFHTLPQTIVFAEVYVG